MIRIEDLHVRLPEFSLEGIHLHARKGAFFALLGPTGAGKTVLLESVAGLLPATQGAIHIKGRDVTALPPEQRAISIVYQDSALFPHLDVRKNITYGLRYHKVDSVRNGQRGQKDMRFDRLVDALGIGHLLERGVTHLSGGEKQRVALARALVVDPDILLLDEPLSALDPNFRVEIRDILQEIHQKTGITVLMVTHDFAEARHLADRIAILHNGRLAQTGSSDDIFTRPATPFTAAFVGMSNLYEVRFHRHSATLGEVCFTLPASPPSSHHLLAFRPDAVRLERSEKTNGAPNRLPGRIRSISHNGHFLDIRIENAAFQYRALVSATEAMQLHLSVGDKVVGSVTPEALHSMAAQRRSGKGEEEAGAGKSAGFPKGRDRYCGD
jgi:molybdate/tungstate transport system ATP-binding protein